MFLLLIHFGKFFNFLFTNASTNIKRKKTWDVVGLFIITLFLTLPFYSANVLAATIDVTKNHGQAGLEGFLDATGDIWTLEAVVSGSEVPVIAESLVITLAGREAVFDSCSESEFGATCNALSAGPITINAGITLTIPSRSSYTVV